LWGSAGILADRQLTGTGSTHPELRVVSQSRKDVDELCSDRSRNNYIIDKPFKKTLPPPIYI